MLNRAVLRTAAAALALVGVVAAGSASFSAASSSGAGDTIVVQPGDTLWAIAGDNGISVAQLAAANHMAPTDLLLIGRQLTIPGVGATSARATSAAMAPAGPAATSPTDFCADTTFSVGPYGEIPSLLATSPDRLALRPLFVQWADRYGVAPALVEAVAWQESGWQENVVSGDGAVGIGQLLPSTASFVNNDLLGTNLNINVASDNIRMEAVFLAYLIRQVGDNPCDVAAAYYEGPTALVTDGVFAESEQYVRDVLSLEPQFD